MRNYDFLAIDNAKEQAEKTALVHAGLMSTATCIAISALIFRTHDVPTGGAKWLSLAAAALVGLCLMIGGWFGGHLVFHHGIGQD